MSAPRTLLAKLWDSHEIARRDDGASLLWVDRHLVHEGSHHAFGKLMAKRRPMARPDLTVAVADHYVPTDAQGRKRGGSGDAARMIATLTDNAERHGLRLFGLGDPRQGIVHVVGPEQGLTLPGLSVVCGDSHTSTHGALGALGFGIGATEVAHVLATQTVWQRRPKAMRLAIEGALPPGVTAKDMALTWIARPGGDGARGHAIEYAGSAVRALSMEGRLTLCNLSIEGGAKLGLVAPDTTTVEWIEGRSFCPKGASWTRAVNAWAQLTSDPNASFDREITLTGAEIVPTVTWGTSPDQALPVTAPVPDPRNLPQDQQIRAERALDYMGLTAGRPLQGTPIDRVFIGSCTNARIEDLRAAAAVLAGRRAKVPGLVSPGSSLVRAQAEEEGLARIFTEAGLTWGGAGCSMCVAMNGDMVPSGERCASTTNRNFRGRQGQGARTHLMSPAMAAGAAVTGTITDVRPFLDGRAVA